MKSNLIPKKQIQPAIVFLNRHQVDFLDKLGKDALFSKGIKLSRNKIINCLVDLIMELGIDGEGISCLEELKQRIQKRLSSSAVSPEEIPEKIDKREFPRLNLNLEVGYRILESLEPLKITQTLDMSEKGIRINLPEYIQPETRLELTMKIPNEPEPMRVIGRVVWIKEDSRQRFFTTGIHLIHLREEDKERFYKYAFVEELKTRTVNPVR